MPERRRNQMTLAKKASEIFIRLPPFLNRIARLQARNPGKVRVFFSIPLAGKRDEATWRMACSVLGCTLKSILQQTDSDFEVVIAGHEKPSIPEIEDNRVTFITSYDEKPTETSQFRADKRSKKILTAQHIRKQGGGYVVFLDADDLVSKYLVKYIREKNDPNGYIFHKGYALDYMSRVIAPIPGAWSNTFNIVCGSSAAVHIAKGEIGRDRKGVKKSYYGRFLGPHALWEEVASGEGHPLRPIPFPAAVYVLNTSLNISTMLHIGEKGLKERIRRIHAHRIPLTEGLIEEFAIPLAHPSTPQERVPSEGHL